MNAVAKIAAESDPAQVHVTVPHVLTAINRVMEDLSGEGIAKSRKNQAQGYNFRGIDDVYNALAPVLAKHCLVITPRCLSRDVQERLTQKGAPLFYVTVDMEFTLSSAIDGSNITARMYGEAMDSADKATNKAMSAAYKYMAMQAFCIPTEGDNDADAHTHDVQPNRKLQTAADMAINLLRGCSADAALFKEAWTKNFEGWKKVMDPADYARVQAVKAELVKKFAAEAEAAKPAPKHTMAQDGDDPFDDPIPF